MYPLLSPLSLKSDSDWTASGGHETDVIQAEGLWNFSFCALALKHQPDGRLADGENNLPLHPHAVIIEASGTVTVEEGPAG
jgi:hypothetical protein